MIDLPKGLFASGLLTKTLYAFLDCSIHATCPAQLGSLDLRFLIILGEGPGSSSDKALDYELDGPGSIPGVGGVEIFLHSMFRLALESTQPPIK